MVTRKLIYELKKTCANVAVQIVAIDNAENCFLFAGSLEKLHLGKWTIGAIALDLQ